MITVCVTSCNRWELLEQTLDSFLNLNTYPIERYLLHEDSDNVDIVNKIKEKYPMFEVFGSGYNVGLLKSIDNLYSLVKTDYIFHLEDDWNFESNSNFIQESLNVLENKDIHQV